MRRPALIQNDRLVRCLIGAIAVTAAFLFTAAASADTRPRIASINLCTDQLLLDLADPDQILGLSPYARDPAHAYAAAQARRFPLLSGKAEDVLLLKPDIVVAGRFDSIDTRALLQENGVRVVAFAPADSVDDVLQQLRLMGHLVGHPERAEAAVARIEAALARAKEAVASRPYRVLAVSRRGYVAGTHTLMDSLLAVTGLSNAAGDLGFREGGYASLETLVMVKPDLILLSENVSKAEDQGEAFLLHPALQDIYPPDRRIVIPEQLTACGGPMLANALDALVDQLKRVKP